MRALSKSSLILTFVLGSIHYAVRYTVLIFNIYCPQNFKIHLLSHFTLNEGAMTQNSLMTHKI